MRIDADAQAALATGHKDFIELQGAVIQHGFMPGALAERGDTADHIAAFTHRDFRVGHRCFLRTDRCRQGLQIHMAADRDDTDYALLAGIRHQGFKHLLGVETEFFRRLDAIPLIHVVVRVVVFIQFELHAGAFQLQGCRSRAHAFVVVFLLAHAPHACTTG